MAVKLTDRKYSFARRMILCGVTAGSTLLILAACVPPPAPSSSSSSSVTPSASARTSASASPSTTPSARPSPTPSASPVASGTAVKIHCSTLISAQAVYDFNPNFSLQATFAPKAGTPAALAIADRGIACGWINQTSSDTFTFSVAHPTPSVLASLKTSAAAGTAVAGYGDSAYFSTTGGVGRVDVFTGVYWMTASSVYFATANDASVLLKSALGSLK